MSINRALGDWISRIQGQWLDPVHPALPLWHRLLYASFGSYLWAFYTIFQTQASPELNLSLAGNFGAILVLLVGPFLFGWIVSWPARPYSPARLFLGGILLPTVTVYLFNLPRLVGIS